MHQPRRIGTCRLATHKQLKKLTGHVNSHDPSTMQIGLPIVAVFAFRGGNSWIDADQGPRHYPTLLAGSKARSQKPVIDFPGYGKPVVLSSRNEQPAVVSKPIRRSVGIAFSGGNDAVTIRIYPFHFRCVSIEQALIKISHSGFKRGEPFVDV